jgi:hypothetical protein
MNTAEFKLVALREIAPPGSRPPGDCPDQIVAYWREFVATGVTFRPEVENLVVILLNTRKKITGHFHVSTGTLDTLLVHPREVFRPAIAAQAGASAIVLGHNLCAAAHKLCYVQRLLMCSHSPAVLPFTLTSRRKEGYA